MAAVSFAADFPTPTSGSGTIYGGNAELSKAVTDTIDLMGPTGSGALYLGDFEAGFFNSGEDLANQISVGRVRLDHHQRLLHQSSPVVVRPGSPPGNLGRSGFRF